MQKHHLSAHPENPPDFGFKIIAESSTHKDTLAKFVLFDILELDDCLYFYFHSWYQRYKNALIVFYKCKTLSSDTSDLINMLSHNYETQEQNIYDVDDIRDHYSDKFVEELKCSLTGKNIMIVYRSNKRDELLSVHNFELYKNKKMLVSVKPGIRIPKILLPKKEEVKIDISNVLGSGKIKKVGEA